MANLVAAAPQTLTLYRLLRQANPQAVEYYTSLKKRIEEGQKAQLVMNALQAIHAQHKASVSGLDWQGHVVDRPSPYEPRPESLNWQGHVVGGRTYVAGLDWQGHVVSGRTYVAGAMPEGAHVTPNGRIMSKEVMSRLCAACYAGCR